MPVPTHGLFYPGSTPIGSNTSSGTTASQASHFIASRYFGSDASRALSALQRFIQAFSMFPIVLALFEMSRSVIAVRGSTMRFFRGISVPEIRYKKYHHTN